MVGEVLTAEEPAQMHESLACQVDRCLFANPSPAHKRTIFKGSAFTKWISGIKALPLLKDTQRYICRNDPVGGIYNLANFQINCCPAQTKRLLSGHVMLGG